MSLTKEMIYEQHDRELKERAECKDCRFEWDDKFWQLCERHSRKMQEAEAEQEYYSLLSTDYDLMSL